MSKCRHENGINILDQNKKKKQISVLDYQTCRLTNTIKMILLQTYQLALSQTCTSERKGIKMGKNRKT